MNIFFRDWDPKSPIASGVEWMWALTARVALVLFVYSMPHLDIGRRLLLNARQAWVFCLILAAWFGLSLYPQTAGLANVINAVLLAIGTLQLLDRAKEIGTALSEGLSLAYNAKSDEDLKAAGKAIAPALSGSLVTLIELFVSYGAFKAVEFAIVRRFPIPKWFEEQFSRAQKQAEADKNEPAESLPPEKVAEEPRQSRVPKEEVRVEKSPSTRANTAAHVASGAVRLEGARKTGEVVGNLDLMAVGLVLAGGAVFVAATAAVLLSRQRS